MENYIKNIELINQYLNKSLSENESISFLNRLKIESEFNELYVAHLLFIEGLKRQTFRAEIKKAQQHYVKLKWFKYFGILTILVVVSVLVYVLLFNNAPMEPKPILETKESSILSDARPSDFEMKALLQDTLSSNDKDRMEETMVSSEKELKKDTLPVESLKKAPQFFVFDSSKDTIMVGKEGTKLVIKANAFVDANNRKVEGKINMAVTEYYTLSDMLLANLTTKSNGEPLETGGMLYLEATQGGTELMLAPNSSMDIWFPSQNQKDDMQLFSGTWENGNINWKLQENADNLKNAMKPIISDINKTGENLEVPFAVVEQVPLFPGCEEVDRTKQKTCTSDAITNHVQTNFNLSIAEKLGLKGRLRVTALFKINKNGDVVNIQSRGVHPEIEEEANRVVGLLPRMLPGKQRGKPVTVPYGLPILFQIDVASGKRSTIGTLKQGLIPSDSLINVNFENSLIGENNVRAASVNSYILRTLNLGWINCDRFINRSTQRVNYRIKVNDGNGAVVSMIFKSINSILPSQNFNEIYHFGTVGMDEDVVIVAIKKKDKKWYVDIIETKTEENPDLEFNFKEVTIQELKIELQKLNKLL